jgi:hypothetical protein
MPVAAETPRKALRTGGRSITPSLPTGGLFGSGGFVQHPEDPLRGGHHQLPNVVLLTDIADRLVEHLDELHERNDDAERCHALNDLPLSYQMMSAMPAAAMTSTDG